MRIYLTGDSLVNGEIKKAIGSKPDFSHDPSDADLIIESTNFPPETKLSNIKSIDKNNPNRIPVLSSSLCVTVEEQCKVCSHPETLVGIGLYPTCFSAETNLLEISCSKITDKGILNNAEKMLEQLGLRCVRVPDKPGMVFPRILAMIINEAVQLHYEKIASKEDIDTAMKLGTNYPYGPLEWADRIGMDLIYEILVSLENYSGEERYRPHPFLAKAAKKSLRELG